MTTLGINCFKDCIKLNAINIPNTVSTIGRFCFEDCESLNFVDIPSSVTDMTGAFYHCTGLISLSCSAQKLLPYEYMIGAPLVMHGCFEGCTNLKTAILHNSVSSLGDNCFLGCTSLTDISIPSSVKEIGDFCFTNCTNLEKIVLPDSITRLTATFYNCKRLKSITLPALTKTLSDHDWYKFTIANAGGCFDGCTSLTEITIPESVTEIGSLCFHGCESLCKVTCYAATPPKTSNSFEDENKKMLYVPEASIVAYKIAEEWKDFGNIISLNVTGIRTTSEGNFRVAFEDGKLTFTNMPANEMVNVYTTTGTLLGSGRGDLTVYATRGQVVIAKIGTHTYKLLLK